MLVKILIYAASVVVVLALTILIVVITSKTKKLNKTSEVLYELLPLLNCKECGRKDCAEFAEHLSKGKTYPDVCPYLTGKNYIRIREVLKHERKVHFDTVAFVKCEGGIDCKNKFKYIGDNTCSSKNLQHNGDKFCPFACLGCGDCVRSEEHTSELQSPS